MTLSETIDLIRAAHDGQIDKAGEPYWLHPFAVMKSLGDDTLAAQQVALLHDVLEDTDITVDDLIATGFSSDVIWAVRVLTRSPDQTYMQYVLSIIDSGSKLAKRVKMADLRHNLSRNPPDSLAVRYRKALAILEADYE